MDDGGRGPPTGDEEGDSVVIVALVGATVGPAVTGNGVGAVVGVRSKFTGVGSIAGAIVVSSSLSVAPLLLLLLLLVPAPVATGGRSVVAAVTVPLSRDREADRLIDKTTTSTRKIADGMASRRLRRLELEVSGAAMFFAVFLW